MTKDDIEYELRYAGQSTDYREWRSIANNLLTNISSGVQRKAIEDGLDDFISSNDAVGAKDYLLKIARERVSAQEEKWVKGREDALFALGDIERLLSDFTAKGGNTGLISGNIEKLQQSVLKRTGNQELAFIANEISLIIQKYRQELTGAAFTESEAKEYAKLFPNIEKSPQLNEALIKSMRNAYERNLRLFYERELGRGNFQKLEQLSGQKIVGGGDKNVADLSKIDFKF
jgi:hypothetical protein